jgi:hypothetical protein
MLIENPITTSNNSFSILITSAYLPNCTAEDSQSSSYIKANQEFLCSSGCMRKAFNHRSVWINQSIDSWEVSHSMAETRVDDLK